MCLEVPAVVTETMAPPVVQQVPSVTRNSGKEEVEDEEEEEGEDEEEEEEERGDINGHLILFLSTMKHLNGSSVSECKEMECLFQMLRSIGWNLVVNDRRFDFALKFGEIGLKFG